MTTNIKKVVLNQILEYPS